jgi:hypothetical protein
MLKKIKFYYLFIIFIFSENFYSHIAGQNKVFKINSQQNSNHQKPINNQIQIQNINKNYIYSNNEKNYSAFYTNLLNSLNDKNFEEIENEEILKKEDSAAQIKEINDYIEYTAGILSKQYNIQKNSVFYIETIEKVKEKAYSKIFNENAESIETKKKNEETAKELIDATMEKINEKKEIKNEENKSEYNDTEQYYF